MSCSGVYWALYLRRNLPLEIGQGGWFCIGVTTSREDALDAISRWKSNGRQAVAIKVTEVEPDELSDAELAEYE